MKFIRFFDKYRPLLRPVVWWFEYLTPPEEGMSSVVCVMDWKDSDEGEGNPQYW
jgi:hypothetical protein